MKNRIMQIRILSSILILTFLNISVFPLFAIDQYYNFSEFSVKGSAIYEKKRKICVFPFRSQQKEEKFNYLSKGIPSVIISELRSLEFIYIEYPHPEVIYHSLGPKPEYTLDELIEQKSEGIKKKKKIVASEADLDSFRKGQKSLPTAQDPRYVKVEIKQITETKAPYSEDLYAFGAKEDCDFSIAGEFKASDADLKIQVELFDAFEGKIQIFKHESSFIRAYQEMSPLGEKIRFSLQGKETTVVQVDVKGQDNCLVYLDGIFLGKTPVTTKKFPIGKRELFVFKEGHVPFKQSIVLESGKVFSIDVKLIKIENSSFISVKSDVEDADVFLGITYLGKTPLEKVSIPSGLNRLRVSKKDYIDSFRPVEVGPGEIIAFDVPMREGKSEIYYPNKQYLFLDYSYKDFSTYSLYGSLFFYASYLYLNVESRKIIESSRSQVNLVNAVSITSFYQNNPTDFVAWYIFQTNLIESTEARADRLKDIAGTLPTENRRDRQLVGGPMVLGMGLMFALAATFLVLDLDKESFDIGFVPASPGGNGAVSSSQTGFSSLESYGFFNYNHRF